MKQNNKSFLKKKKKDYLYDLGVDDFLNIMQKKKTIKEKNWLDFKKLKKNFLKKVTSNPLTGDIYNRLSDKSLKKQTTAFF